MIKRLTAWLVVFCLIFGQTGFAQVSISGPAGSGFRSVDSFRPVQLRSVEFDPADDHFRLLLDKGGSDRISSGRIEEYSHKLFEYFQVGLALPDSMFWVNLRPDSPERIVEPDLEKTDLGRVLLEADLQLKKDVSRFTSPELTEGKKYWDNLYAKAEELYGAQDVDIPTYTRPWIVPGEIILRVSANGAFIYKAALKVKLEQDYIKDSSVYDFSDQRNNELNAYSARLMREIVIPRLTREVNSSRRYAPLRQVYYSLILAQFFKAGRQAAESGPLPRKIGNRDLNGLTSKTVWSKDTYYQAYRDSVQRGEYKKEESVRGRYGVRVRQYFSGGVMLDGGGITSVRGKITSTLGALADGLIAKVVTPAENPVVRINDVLEFAPLTPLQKLSYAERLIEYVNSNEPETQQELEGLYEKFFSSRDISAQDRKSILTEGVSGVTQERDYPFSGKRLQLALVWNIGDIRGWDGVSEKKREAREYSAAVQVADYFARAENSRILFEHGADTREAVNDALRKMDVKPWPGQSMDDFSRAIASRLSFKDKYINAVEWKYRIVLDPKAKLSQLFIDDSLEARKKQASGNALFLTLGNQYKKANGEAETGDEPALRIITLLQANRVPAKFWEILNDYRYSLRYREFAGFIAGMADPGRYSVEEMRRLFIAHMGTVRLYRCIALPQEQILFNENSVSGLRSPFLERGGSRAGIDGLMDKYGIPAITLHSMLGDESASYYEMSPEELRNPDGWSASRVFLSFSEDRDMAVAMVRRVFNDEIKELKALGERIVPAVEKRFSFKAGIKGIFNQKISSSDRSALILSRITAQGEGNMEELLRAESLSKPEMERFKQYIDKRMRDLISRQLYVVEADVPLLDVLLTDGNDVLRDVWKEGGKRVKNFYYPDLDTGNMKQIQDDDASIELLVAEVEPSMIRRVSMFRSEGEGFSNFHVRAVKPEMGTVVFERRRDGGNLQEIETLGALMRQPAFLGNMAGNLKKAYRHSQGRTGYDLSHDTNPTGLTKRDIERAQNLLGFLGLENGISALLAISDARKGGSLVQVVKDIRDNNLSGDETRLLELFARATWMATLAFRVQVDTDGKSLGPYSLLREHPDFVPAGLSSSESRENDLAQIQTAADFLYEKIKDIGNSREQLVKLESLLKDPGFLDEMARKSLQAYNEFHQQRDTERKAIVLSEDTALSGFTNSDLDVALNLLGFVATVVGVEAVLEISRKGKGQLFSDVLRDIVRQQQGLIRLPDEENMLLMLFANATWKAGVPFRVQVDESGRSLGPYSRVVDHPDFIRWVNLPVPEQQKDIVQIQAAAAELLLSEMAAKKADPGGIDFRSLPVRGQLSADQVLMAQLAQLSADSRMTDLDREWKRIKKEISDGNTPYGRIREYIAVCLNRDGCKKFLHQPAGLIMSLLKKEEEQTLATSPELKELLRCLG